MKNRRSDAAIVHISLLGGLAIRAPDGRAIALAGRKDRALLGYLAATAGTACPRERLAALLWGDSAEPQARDSLKQALLRLRRALAPASETLLTSTRQSVVLDVKDVTVDVAAFERSLRDGGVEALEHALALYQGDLLEGLDVPQAGFEDWLAVERQRLRGLAIDGATVLMAQAMEERRWDRAHAAARRLLSLEPLHEAACRTLMQVHSARGERAQALKLFDSLRERLRRELAVAPEAETLDLHRAIRERRDDGRKPSAASLTAALAPPAKSRVRISAQPAFAARWLIRRLGRFRDAWPCCEVVIDATPSLADLGRGEADLAIRRGPGTWGGLPHELLVRSRVFPVAAPSLLGGGAPPARPGELLTLPLLHDDDGALWRRWFAAAGLRDVDPPKGPRILETGLAIDAAIAGQGVVLADRFLVADDLAAERLVTLCDVAIADWDYYLVGRAGAPCDGATLRFRDWLLRDTEALRRDEIAEAG
ncbi:MAG TPA: LysR substrate-binding domain-containing protein [Kiloniellaceae bacterium]|nr:LysR substrate-binding domain-containing protein [Kiloniellaceae bacterium]